MAGTPKVKITAEDIANAEKQIKFAAEASGTEAVAEVLGKSVKVVEGILEKGLSTKAGQQLIKTVDNLDKKLLELRAPKQTTPPSVLPEYKTEVTGPLAAGKGKGFTSMPSTGERGGPLAPVTQPGRLDSVASKLQASEVAYDPVTKAPMSSETALVPFGSRSERPVMSPAEIAEAAKQAKPGVAGRGVSEVTPESKTRIAEAGRTEAERAADFELRMQGLPSERAVELGAKAAKAGKYAVGGAAAGAGGLGLGLVGKMLFDKGFSGDETAPPVVKEAGVEDAADVKTVVGTIPETAMPAEQKQAVEKQVDEFTEAIQSFERRMAAEGKEARDEKKLKEGRLEFMRALETIMHGMVSALGANAMLNRGSPFALDFSKGPQTDWASEFDRLQKSYDSQMAEIRSRYGLAMKEKQEQRAAAQAASREAREEKRLELQERALEQRGAAAQEKQAQRAAGQAEKAAEKQLALREKAFAELSGSIAALKEKSTPISAKQVTANATRLGIPPEEIKLLIDKTTGKGFFNFADENKVAEILEKYRPGQAAAEAAPAAEGLVDMIAPDGRKLKVPASKVQELEARGAKRS